MSGRTNSCSMRQSPRGRLSRARTEGNTPAQLARRKTTQRIAQYMNTASHAPAARRQVVFDAECRQRRGDAQDEQEIVHHHDAEVHRQLRAHRGMRAEVQCPVQHITQPERAPVRHGHRDRHRESQPTAQQREQQQIDGERPAVDHRESQKRRRHNVFQPERQPREDCRTGPVESSGHRCRLRLRHSVHVAKVPVRGCGRMTGLRTTPELRRSRFAGQLTCTRTMGSVSTGAPIARSRVARRFFQARG